MALTTFWFIVIAVLWTGYFVLEGFDFGVGMLFPVLGSDETCRRVLLNTIGPVWDGNEVWLLTAGGATFAAFPNWYATLFSGFYLALLLILVALIVRALGFEYRGKRDDDRWRRNWDYAIFLGSVVPSFLWGVAFTNIVRGVPIDAQMTYTGSLLTLLNPIALLGGLMTLAVFLTHGLLYVALKTEGVIRQDARALAVRVGAIAAVLVLAVIATLNVQHGDGWSWLAFAVGVIAFAGGWLANLRGREGWAFAGTFLAIGCVVAALFLMLFPDVMPSSTNAAWSLTTTNASSSHRTLVVMSWVAVVFTPFVLAYQSWTYWTFRKRIGTRHIPPAYEPKQPAAAGVD